MKSLLFTLTGLLILISSPLSFGDIGRVGNSSIGSDIEGFETTLPSKFPLTRKSQTRLLMRSVDRVSSSSGSEIEAIPLREVFFEIFEEAQHWTRQTWQDRLERSTPGLDLIVSEAHPCILATRHVDKSNRIIGLATWGQGNGIVLNGTGDVLSWRAIEQILEEIELSAGDCGW